MKHSRQGLALSVLVLQLSAHVASAAEPATEHTFRLAEGEAVPNATLADANWLVGSWTGTAFGERFEEVWNPPSAGSMIGMFKLLSGTEVGFYELLLLTVEGGTLSLKVKHFNPDFSAWEDKTDFVDFRLVAMTDDALHFSGISFYRRDRDHIDAYIVLHGDAGMQEHHLTYVRDE